MKMIRINGMEQEIPQEQTIFGEYLDGLNEALKKERLVVSRICVDGIELDESAELGVRNKSIDELGAIELETSNPATLALETLSTLQLYLDRMITNVEKAAAAYRTKNLISGDKHFSKSIDGLDLFVQTIGGVKLALRVGINPTVALCEVELVSIMNDLLEAKRANNHVYMSELLEKELVANLREWQEKAFPAMKKYAES